MTSAPRGKALIEFPSDLEVVLTREFEAPLPLVWDVFTKPEHIRNTIAPYGETVTVCEVDLRVGGDYHYVFVTDDGDECSFRGKFLELDPPNRMVETWRFDGWPDVEAVETITLTEVEDGTRMSWALVFADQAGRDHMTRFDGAESNFENVAVYLKSLLEKEGSAAR